jgi:imidazolonepropionase-like amidohydrolase
MKCVIVFIQIIITTGLLSTATASNQIPAAPQRHPIALMGGTLHPVSGAAMENGIILFDGGKIIALGKEVELPDNAERIDVSGRHVYPGLIAANTQIGLIEINSIRQTHDFQEVGEIKPNVMTNFAVNPDSDHIPVTRYSGFAIAQSVPVNGLIPGMSSLILLDGWTSEEMTLKAPVALHINLPAIKINRNRAEESRRERDEQLRKIQETFDQARAYWKAKQAEMQEGIPYHETDVRWDMMKGVLEREIPVVIQADDIPQIETALEWAERENLRLIISGGRDAWRIAERLKEKKVPVIVGGTHTLNFRGWEGYNQAFTLPKKLYEAGVPFCIGVNHSAPGPAGVMNVRNLIHEAATAAAHGLPAEEALKALTLYPAQIFGVEDQVGSLETGKDATLIVTTGDPLELTSQVEQMYIQGRKIDLSSRHTLLYDKYKTRYEQYQE